MPLERIMSEPSSTDGKLAASYASYHIGRFLSLVGSVVLVAGLVLKLIFLKEEYTVMNIMAMVLIGFAIFFIVTGIVFVVVSGAKAHKQRTVASDEERLRATSTFSVSSAASSSQTNYMYVQSPLNLLNNNVNNNNPTAARY